jgi:hypothetical protein
MRDIAFQIPQELSTCITYYLETVHCRRAMELGAWYRFIKVSENNLCYIVVLRMWGGPPQQIIMTQHCCFS